MSPAPSPHPAASPGTKQVQFHPDVVADLIRPIKGIIESLAYELRSQDLTKAEVHLRWVHMVDQALLRREPWSHVVPGTLREALISRLLRGHCDHDHDQDSRTSV